MLTGLQKTGFCLKRVDWLNKIQDWCTNIKGLHPTGKPVGFRPWQTKGFIYNEADKQDFSCLSKSFLYKERRMVVEKVETQIYINSIDTVKDFASSVIKFQSDIDLVSGRYVVDAKSIMGIFSLDLSRPISLIAYPETMQEAYLIKEMAERFSVK